MNALKLGLCFAMVISVVIADISPDYKNAATKERLRKIIENMNGLSKNDLVTEMNGFLDNVLGRLNGFIQGRYDSRQKLPNILDHEFSWGLVMSGKLSLTEMWLTGLSTLTREENVGIELTDNKIIYYFPVSYENLEYNGDYMSKVTLITHEGTLEGRVKQTRFTVVIEVDLITLRAELRDLKQHGSWKITSDFSGILGNLLWIVSGEVKDILPPIIKATTRDFTLDGINSALAIWNQE